MKKFLAILLLGFSSLVTAQTVQTTPNLITSGTNHTWTGVTTGALPTGCGSNGSGGCAGGPGPLYDPTTNTIHFSYNTSAYVGQTIAINNALAGVGAGIKINGYNYGYDVRNMNLDNRQPSTDTFTVGTALRGANNSVLLSHNQYFNTKFEWTTYTGTKTATTPIDPANATYMQIGITGGDNGYWGGYFGPEVRNVNMSLNYSVDPCATNPAYSPTCANYNTVSTQSLFSGATGPQVYAINQALSGSGVMVHGFDYGYNYSVGGRFCNWMDFLGGCLGTWIYPSASMTTTVTDNTDTAIFTETNTHGAGAVGTYNKALRFGASRPISTMGTFSMTPSTNNGAQITNMYGTAVYTADPCVTNPLSSTSCPGYAQAYLDQQCTANPLYNSACPGYAAAMFTQQCNANQLSNPSCPGYANAYLTLQCTANPLYSTTCQGYDIAQTDCSINPLSHSYCTNYQTATTECGTNPLYGSFCPMYATASLECSTNPLSHSYCPMYQSTTESCTTNALTYSYCPGYQTASTQCTSNPLSNSLCTGYQTATTECSSNPLSQSYCPGYSTATTQCSASALYAPYCPGYQFAYACQQDGLYSNQCPNYSTAYAKKMLLEQQGIAGTVATAGTVAQVAAVAAADPANATESATASAVSSDPVVASAVTTKTTTAASSETSPAAPVKLVAPPPAPAQQMAQADPKKDNGPGEKKEEKKDEGNKPNAGSNNNPGAGSDSKPNSQPTSNRQALAERRREAAQKEAVAKGKDLANEMGKAADMEAQKAVQNVVIQAMGFTPGFDTYNKAMLPDTRFYKPYTVYGGQVTVDNKNVSRRLMGGSDKTHQDMVDSQYNKGN